MVTFKKATTTKEYEIAKGLFKKYAEDLRLDLSFQSFDSELEHLENQYGAPEGTLFLIFSNETRAIGCFGIRKFNGNVCELKRMFLEQAYRGKGLGGQMMEKAILEAKKLGYEKIRLDSLRSMKPAIALYKGFGFKEVEAYRFNPMEDAVYFEKDLNN